MRVPPRWAEVRTVEEHFKNLSEADKASWIAVRGSILPRLAELDLTQYREEISDGRTILRIPTKGGTGELEAVLVQENGVWKFENESSLKRL